ncbi:hypothetical protein HOP50_19g84000 [Chloropicon primus]|uniref:Uncharacterized protein n=1 Tax=Chloropicon primus TaxID=1764295 RepID=A0A5B8MYH7_9CHLO|nr:hypothetical protein A3770_19p83760 [Chloropicon primus]UPR05053.1 hypothetical protein HOP50_19g84000 [Chloropicon primus]|eukprot:QDZ25858.1 hypothetical protein A3770_19p83760 [Chloropicon primus]
MSETAHKVHMSTTMPHYVAGVTGTGKTNAQITPRAMDVPSTSGVSPGPMMEQKGGEVANYYRERGELVPHEAHGVWIATNLWKKMRKELAARERQVEDLQAEHKQEMLKLIESTNHVNIRNRELTDQLARVENIHLQKQKQLEEQITDLHSRLDSAIRSSEKQKFEHEAEIDYLTRLLSERHEADEQVKVLQQQLDEAVLKVKLEKHRCTVSVNRTKVLEKEIEFFKDQHVRNKQKTQELEERNREVVKQVTVNKQEIQKYKDKVKLASRPNEILKREKDRYKGDCQRLMYLLESSEHKRLAKELQRAGSMHYVSLADCLYVEGVNSEKYASLGDRPALANLERNNWVPSKALDLVKDFTQEYPSLNLPLQPFTVLLLQLNKVWKLKEKSILKSKSLEVEKKYAKLKRMTENTKPYKLVICKEKVKHLKKELTTTKVKCEKLDKMKKSFKNANDEHTRLLLQCGVGTIKNLDSQLKGAKVKNKKLSKKLTKISTLAKQKQKDLLEREESQAGRVGGAEGDSMKELLEELQRSHEDVVALSSVASSGGEEEDEEGRVFPEGRVPADDDLVSVLYPEDSKSDILDQALVRKEQMEVQKKHRSGGRTRSRSRSRSKSK